MQFLEEHFYLYWVLLPVLTMILFAILLLIHYLIYGEFLLLPYLGE